jgi:hypothetical protein
MADAAYRIATGRTKGRLMGPEHGYAPALTLPYTIVCFLSGEDSIRAGIEKRGAAARFAEVTIQDPLLPRQDLPAWWTFAEEHHGWYGRFLIPWAIAMYFSLGRNGDPLRDLYAGARDGIASWCPGHSRLLDLLAAVQVGYVLSVHVVHVGLAGAVTRAKRERIAAEAEEFTHEVYGWLDRQTRIDNVLDAIAATPNIAPWIERGFIPIDCLDGVAKEFGLDKRGAFLDFLRHHGIVSKVEPRKEWAKYAPGQRASRRSYILTPEGKNRLLEKRQTTE